MPTTIQPGRLTAVLPDDRVLFLIGMRVNRLRAVRDWASVARAMPAMLVELGRHPELGLLSARTFVSGRDVMVVQYWNSYDQLMDYARAAEHLHLPAWRSFNRAVSKAGTVGIWHETYPLGAVVDGTVVAPGRVESIYVNMPRFGLGTAGETVDLRGASSSRRDGAPTS